MSDYTTQINRLNYIISDIHKNMPIDQILQEIDKLCPSNWPKEATPYLEKLQLALSPTVKDHLNALKTAISCRDCLLEFSTPYQGPITKLEIIEKINEASNPNLGVSDLIEIFQFITEGRIAEDPKLADLLNNLYSNLKTKDPKSKTKDPKSIIISFDEINGYLKKN